VAVVDDDAAVCDSLRFLLEIAGYEVTTYASGAEFLQDAEPGELVCVITDQHMPDLTGLQMIARLRAREVSLPVALITGSVSGDLVCRAQELNVALVLEKPLDDDRLIEFVALSVG
jgi:FixJ family two-component response regulator